MYKGGARGRGRAGGGGDVLRRVIARASLDSFVALTISAICNYVLNILLLHT